MSQSLEGLSYPTEPVDLTQCVKPITDQQEKNQIIFGDTCFFTYMSYTPAPSTIQRVIISQFRLLRKSIALITLPPGRASFQLAAEEILHLSRNTKKPWEHQLAAEGILDISRHTKEAWKAALPAGILDLSRTLEPPVWKAALPGDYLAPLAMTSSTRLIPPFVNSQVGSMRKVSL